MCIYLGDLAGLTYNTQEHVLPAALGCCTKLEKGVVSDQANEYFSPIERDVLEHSLIQLPRIIIDPGKRGKLSEKYATISEVSVINLDGKNGLGYMKGTKGYLLSQFVIDKERNVRFHYQSDDRLNARNEIEQLQEKLLSMGEKYVPVEMPQDDDCIYIAFFKNKIHIGSHNALSDSKIEEIKGLFSGKISESNASTSCGQLSATIEIKHNFKNICIVAIKSALNTLAYLKGAKYITQTTEFKTLIDRVMSGNDEVLNSVVGIGFEALEKMRQSLHLDNNQLACILNEQGNKLKAWLFIYEHGYEVSLCDSCTTSCDLLLDGIVCDWKNRRDYRFLDYLKTKKILC